MVSLDFRKDAREKLSGKWGKAALITLSYAAISTLLNLVQNKTEGVLYSIVSIIVAIIQVPLSFGFIMSFVKLFNAEDVGSFDFLKSGFDNFKKEYAITGSLFLDKDFDTKNGSSNYLIYGHRNKQGLMFEDLLKYANEDFYEAHKKIKFTTNKEDSIYDVVSVFYSRVYYKKEQDVFRYYYFVNANNEEEYNDFIYNAKKVSLYDTGINPQYGEQLITLSTCEYSQEDGRFVVVFKKEGTK